MIPTQQLIALERLVVVMQQRPALDPTEGKDPLVDRGLETWQYVGIVAIAIGAIALMGFVSCIKYAVLFAIALSAILIAVFLTL